jgi:hypothetical protein
MIEARGLSKRYGDKMAVDDLSFTVQPGRVTGFNPGGNEPQHRVEFFLVTALLYLLAPASAWVLGDSMGYRRAYSAALEERAARAERERDAQAQIAAAASRTSPSWRRRRTGPPRSGWPASARPTSW